MQVRGDTHRVDFIRTFRTFCNSYLPVKQMKSSIIHSERSASLFGTFYTESTEIEIWAIKFKNKNEREVIARNFASMI